MLAEAVSLGEVSRYNYNHIMENVEAVKNRLLPSRGSPTYSNRWCSRLKVSKPEETYSEYCVRDSECIVIVGDRDVESELRSLKPRCSWEQHNLCLPIETVKHATTPGRLQSLRH
ncbi:hypothetical protein [Desulfurococcus sp.]|uniref:hypothetical protein n=1 Tax=Desulfurococcus sp. TaxID=51678 RepID=UPI003D0CE1E1